MPDKPVDAAALLAAGLIRRTLDGVRLLGEGELKAKLALTVNHASAKAKAAIEQAGGSITLIEQQGAGRRRGQTQEIGRKKGQDGQGQAGPPARTRPAGAGRRLRRRAASPILG